MRHRNVRSLIVAVAFICLGSGPAFALDWDSITLNGYTGFEFETQLTDEGNGDPNHSFDADLFDLVLNFQISDRVRASTDLTWEHGAASEDARGNVAMEYGFMEYTVTDLLRVQVGKLFVPFGVFNEIHTAKPAFLTVKEAASTNKSSRIVDNALRFYPRWAAGINLRGDAPVGDSSFDYDLMISNGEQEATNPFEADNNASKAITGRLRFYLGEVLHMGLSFNYDKPEFDGIERQVAVGFEVAVQIKDVELMLEAVYGEFRLTQATSDDPDKQRQLGAFVQGAYRLPWGTTPYLRLETVDPEIDASDDEGFLFLWGINQRIDDLILKIEHNYVFGREESTLAEFSERRFHEIKAAVVLGF